MIEILTDSKNLTELEAYVMTKKASKMIKDVEGQTLNIIKWVLFNDKKENGTIVKVLSMLDDNGVVYATNSRNFQEDFADLVGMISDLPPILITGGETRSGKHFVNFIPVLKKVNAD